MVSDSCRLPERAFIAERDKRGHLATQLLPWSLAVAGAGSAPSLLTADCGYVGTFYSIILHLWLLGHTALGPVLLGGSH